MDSLSAIRAAVLASQGPSQLTMLSMRVMLETGLSLQNVSMDKDRDPQSVARVRKALADMHVKV